jgi:hypothetical protein
MVEVRIKAEKLKDEIQRRSESGFLKYLLRHNKEEPVIIGPGSIFYITDHHHLARALYEVGASTTYCTIVDNLSDAKADDFWKHLKDNNEVYLEDQNGNPIKPNDLPTSVKDLRNDPFRSLAGAVRESCGFEKGRSHWAQTGIAIKDIDANFDNATNAALHLAAEKDAASLLAIPVRFPAIEQSLRVRRRRLIHHLFWVAILCRAVCVAVGSLHYGSGQRSPLSLRA